MSVQRRFKAHSLIPTPGPGVCVCVWGGTLIFSYIRRLGLFSGFKILNFNIFGGFQRNEFLLGYEDFVDILSSQNWISIWGSFLCILGSFLEFNIQNGDFFFFFFFWGGGGLLLI